MPMMPIQKNVCALSCSVRTFEIRLSSDSTGRIRFSSWITYELSDTWPSRPSADSVRKTNGKIASSA